MNYPWGKRKYKHQMRGRLRGKTLDDYKLSNKLKMYTYGIKLLENAYVTDNQLQAAARYLRKFSRKIIRKPNSLSSFIRGHVFLARSKKKKGMRMGASKGPFNKLVFVGHAGSIILETRELFCSFPLTVLKIAAKKFSARTEIVKYMFRGL